MGMKEDYGMSQGEWEDHNEEAFEDWVSAQEQDMLRRLSSVPRPKDLKISVEHGTEGPREDPYGWSEWTVTMPDGCKAMWRMGLLSERIELDSEIGKVTFFSPDYDEALGSYEQLFESFVGYPIEQIEYWYNEDWQRGEEVREAELAAGWDPNP